MPKKIEAETRENYWKDRKLFRVLKSENVSTQISFLIGTFNTLVNNFNNAYVLQSIVQGTKLLIWYKNQSN